MQQAERTIAERTKGWKRYTNQKCVLSIDGMFVMLTFQYAGQNFTGFGSTKASSMGKIGLEKVRGRLSELPKQRVSSENFYM